MRVSLPDFGDWHAASHSFEQIAAYEESNITLASGSLLARVPAGIISASAHSLLGVEPIHGRPFAPEDDLPGAERVLAIGERLWQREFGGRPAHSLYVPYTRNVSRSMTLLARAEGDPGRWPRWCASGCLRLTPSSRSIPSSPCASVSTSSTSRSSPWPSLFGAFGLIALALALVGVYRTISYWVGQRTHEIGIRMALGATSGNVVKLVMGQTAKVALIGIAVGAVLALALSSVLAFLLYGVSPSDPATFAGVSLALGAAALLASFLPARRATKVDPIVALRHE